MKSDDIFSILPCAFCGTFFSETQMRIVEKSKKREMFHVVCKSCKGATLLCIIKIGRGMQVVGIQTDCDFDDIMRISDMEAVSVEDVLHVHKALKLDNFL